MAWYAIDEPVEEATEGGVQVAKGEQGIATVKENLECSETVQNSQEEIK